MLHFLKGYDFGVTLSRLRPGKAFCAAERISSCLEHTLLFSDENQNPSRTDWGQRETASPVKHQPGFTPLPPAVRYSGAK